MANAYNQPNAVAAAGNQTYSKSATKAGTINPYDAWGAEMADQANQANEAAKSVLKSTITQTPQNKSPQPTQQKQQPQPKSPQNGVLNFLQGVLGTVKDAAVGVYNSGKNTVQNVGQVIDSTNKQGEYATRLSAVKNQQQFLNDQAKKGVITQADANQRNQKNMDSLNQTANASLKSVQATSKINPLQAASDAADTALNVGTFGGESIIKGVVQKGATAIGKDVTENVGKQTTTQVVKNVAGNVAKESAVGAGYGTSQGLRSGDNKNILPDAALGAAIGGVVPIAGKVLGMAAEKAGLGNIAKTVYGKAADAIKTKLGRDLTPGEADTLAQNTKAAVPEPTPQSNLNEAVPAPTVKEPVVGAEVTPKGVVLPETPVPTPHPMQEPIFNAAKTQIEQKLGRELTPVEATKLASDTQKVVQEKMPMPQTAPEPTGGMVTPKETPVPSAALTTAGDKVSGNSARIEQNALEKQLTDKMGELPQYKSINMKDQAKQAVDFVNNDRQAAIDVINGKAHPPEGLHPQSVHQALENVAVHEGDGQLLTQLAKSHINTELSQGAQKLRIAAERDPHSAVEQIRQLQDTRTKVAEKRYGTTVAKETAKASDTVAKSTRITTKQDLAQFIKELTC